jgi:ParB-like chromosome segregation protein Spo0J
LKIVLKKLDEIKEAPYNPRISIKKNKQFYDKLKHSMDRFGLVQPIVWNKKTNTVVGGHQRLQILRDQGITEIECIEVDLSKEDEIALNLSLNKIGGDWDVEMLVGLLDEIKVDDLGLTGFSLIELEEMRLDLEKINIPKEEKREISNYNIVFNTIDEKNTWERYLKHVRKLYPSNTIAEAIILDITSKGLLDEGK